MDVEVANSENDNKLVPGIANKTKAKCVNRDISEKE